MQTTTTPASLPLSSSPPHSKSKTTTTTTTSHQTWTSSYFSSYAFAFHSMPLAYMLSVPPHAYLFSKLMTASGYAYSNLVPRAQLATLAPTLPKATADMLWRARGCHLNALEGFPLFAAAVLAGTSANLDPKELNTCAAEYLVARTLYSVLYMTVRSERASYLRSAVWAWSVGIPVYVLWKAGMRCVDGGHDGVGAGEKGKESL
ncbi:uncharacterized protein Z520_04385 [Fonsecaea multimorphosa CBS 102226]|uniref:Uncharacterized protein n=1 Tax=Fonsecaea multimorphosa CBS 102226 TaxID=1442371 RepID=A0A0D2K970_9EURO|nr:uncharacterized protein Z520_04385 [Fonsecaea multimorphosa CBS 102226]KIX99749.1 hypothetical protein Z520_04385 [Fonsecaea multimorphosa CBS 102226]OAL26539.1 hypothetical protein AYO22_04150 [Fonsecaea multimorphosa]